MKKIFTLLSMVFAAMSMNAQTILAWEDGMEKANAVTFSNGYKVAITGKPDKTFSAGSKITVDGTVYTTMKLSNGAENTVTAPEGTTFNKVTLYSYINIKAEATKVRPSYWSNINGDEKTADEQGGNMLSCNQVFDSSVEGAAGLVGLDQPDKREFILSAPVSSMTFTNKGEQLGFIMILEMAQTNGITDVLNEKIDINEPIFNLAGQRVTKSYRGVVVRNGKKYIQ